MIMAHAASDPKLTCRYRILRYMPNLIRDEWINIGVLLEEVQAVGVSSSAEVRLALRFIEEDADIARVRRLHPGVDEDLLRGLPSEFQQQLRLSARELAAYLEKLDKTLSNAIQFSPQKGVLTDDFDAELDRLYRDQVAPVAAGRSTIVQNTRLWIRSRLNDVFRRHRLLGKLQRSIPVAEFTQPGDPMRLDYGYRYNGTRGYLHAVALGRDPSQAKVLAYTAECIRAQDRGAEFTAMTETEPESSNPRHQFVARLFADQHIAILPLQRAEGFAEQLRIRIQ